jgi:F420 biosynthesis protein FbiB-like protein
MALRANSCVRASAIFSASAMESAGSADRARLRAIADLIASRRSVRRYAVDPPPLDLVDALLRCAADAPSAHNRQPWRFAVLRAAQSKETLARAMGERLRTDRMRDGDPADDIEKDVRRSFQRITDAPVVLVVAATMVDMDGYPDARRREAEYLMAVQSTAMAVQNLLLAAHAAGLAACWMCAPIFCEDTVRAALGLPADWRPQALVTLGFPASCGKPYRRRPLRDVVLRIDPA